MRPGCLESKDDLVDLVQVNTLNGIKDFSFVFLRIAHIPPAPPYGSASARGLDRDPSLPSTWQQADATGGGIGPNLSTASRESMDLLLPSFIIG
jgi:hypothetical protein